MIARQLAAELLGTAGLLLAVEGSGITASQDDGAAVQLFHHAVVVGLVLAVMIATFAPLSGAHLNPAVTLVHKLVGGMDGAVAAAYVAAQVSGAVGWLFADMGCRRAPAQPPGVASADDPRRTTVSCQESS